MKLDVFHRSFAHTIIRKGTANGKKKTSYEQTVVCASRLQDNSIRMSKWLFIENIKKEKTQIKTNANASNIQ